MKKLFIGIIILVVLAVVTNPNEAKHKEAVKRELDIAMEQELGGFGEFLSSTVKSNGKLISQFIERENQFVYSTTKLKMGGEEKVIGYGFFGFVFINRASFTN